METFCHHLFTTEKVGWWGDSQEFLGSPSNSKCQLREQWLSTVSSKINQLSCTELSRRGLSRKAVKICLLSLNTQAPISLLKTDVCFYVAKKYPLPQFMLHIQRKGKETVIHPTISLDGMEENELKNKKMTILKKTYSSFESLCGLGVPSERQLNLHSMIGFCLYRAVCD